MKPATDSTKEFDKSFGHLIDALPELDVIFFSMTLQCTQARGEVLSRLGITALAGQPVTAILHAFEQAAPARDETFLTTALPSPETFQDMCLAAIDGVGSSFGFFSKEGVFYRIQLLPWVDSLSAMVLVQNMSSETWPEAGLQRFIEAAPDAIIVSNADGRIVLTNRQMNDMFGYSAAELIGQPVEILLPPRVHSRHVHHMHRYAALPQKRQMGSGLDLVAVTKDGRELPVDISLSPMKTSSGMLIISAIRNISDQKKIETELKQARDELERRVQERTADLEHRNEELDAFAHTVAHDLKNPLAIITGMADLMLQYYDELTDEEILKYLGLITRDGRKLDNIINELMALSTLQNMAPTLHPIDVASVAKEAIHRLETMVRQYQAKITCHCDWPWAIGYAPWVETVWVNYLSNAIKYGGQPPIIELGANIADNGMVRYWIKDNGNGLSEGEQDRLFTPFTRLSDIRVQGYGVGLSIVKRAVEKLGGQVGIESQEGRGSLFYFTLPVTAAAPASLQ